MKRTLPVVCACTATLVLLELAARLWGYAERFIYDPIYTAYGASGSIPFVHKPLLVNARARSMTRFSTDRLGLRTGEETAAGAAEQPDAYRIAFAGNSVTFGQGVRTEETFCRLVESELRLRNKQSGVRSFNFGVSGYSVREIAGTVALRIAAVRPDLVVVCLTFEDFDTSRCGGVDRWGYNTRRGEGGLFREDSIVKRALRPFHLVYILREVYDRLAGGPSRASIELLADSGRSVPASYAYLRQARLDAENLGCRFLAVALPSSGWDGAQFRSTVELMKLDGMDVLDLSFLGGTVPPDEYNVGRYDSHPSAHVHRRIADQITDFLTSRSLDRRPR